MQGMDGMARCVSGLHRMLKMNEDDKVMRMTEDELMMQK